MSKWETKRRNSVSSLRFLPLLRPCLRNTAVTMSALDLDPIYAFAIALAQDAGKMIASASLSRTNSNSAHTTSDAAKKNRVDRQSLSRLFRRMETDERCL